MKRARLQRGDSLQVLCEEMKSSEMKKREIAGELFLMIDANADGYITAKELYHALKGNGIQTSKREVIRLFNQLDTNGDKKVSFEEFILGMETVQSAFFNDALAIHKSMDDLRGLIKREEGHHNQEYIPALRELFDMCDKDHSGDIDEAELCYIMIELGVQANPKEVHELFLQLDRNQDGAISFDEFISGVNQLH